ncbi:hypothetical protein [Phycicoccus sp.]|uniref:hypothetical protein n=1 Tax=Phycicoccus sp. TaxID=1902410 RepID=UPI002B74B3B0|nr:hypothetical protein [Phycicoccus sp.]HMM95405.1 hypothetical protein [Phycicoccus sp.]
MSSWSPLQDVVVAGKSVKSYGYGMRLVGGLDSAPGLRGDNLQLAYRRGRAWTPKVHDQATRTLAMWVDARNQDSTYPDTTEGYIRRRNANVRELLSMFGDGSELVVVERQMLLPDELGGDQTWTALAESSNPIVPDWAEDTDEEAFFNVDLTFPDPRWRGPEGTVTVTRGGAPVTIDHRGTLDIDDAVITFHGGSGGLGNPQLNRGSSYLRLGVSIANGDSITVDVGNATAVRESDGANLIAAVVSSGSRAFMNIPKGTPSFTLDGTGAGTADITYRPAFY